MLCSRFRERRGLFLAWPGWIFEFFKLWGFEGSELEVSLATKSFH